jgi:hypothetical protein
VTPGFNHAWAITPSDRGGAWAFFVFKGEREARRARASLVKWISRAHPETTVGFGLFGHVVATVTLYPPDLLTLVDAGLGERFAKHGGRLSNDARGIPGAMDYVDDLMQALALAEHTGQSGVHRFTGVPSRRGQG